MAMLKTCTPPVAHSGDAFDARGGGHIQWREVPPFRIYVLRSGFIEVKELSRMHVVQNVRNP